MNERIKLLAEHAKLSVPQGILGVDKWIEIYNEKLAELIVQDCIDIISPYTVSMHKPGEEYLHPIQEIRKHFGVEEPEQSAVDRILSTVRKRS